MARRTRREHIGPELTPLIDVVFLLLIFFMVSSVFKQDELALLLQLPTTEKGEQTNQAQEKMLNVELGQKDIAVNGTKIEFDAFESNINGYSKESIVNLRVDGKVEYKRLVSILDILKKHKLENLSLITIKKE